MGGGQGAAGGVAAEAQILFYVNAHNSVPITALRRHYIQFLGNRDKSQLMFDKAGGVTA